MKHEASEIAQKIVQEVSTNPKVAAALGGASSATGYFNSNDLYYWLGVALVAVSLYNQVMQAIRTRQDRKRRATDK